MQVKALARELPATHGVPLSLWSTLDIARQVRPSGWAASLSGSTIGRWLHPDAIRPWYHRTWIFPRDPTFATKAGRILDLYARTWNGKPLRQDECVISAGEKTSIPARRRVQATAPPQPHRPMIIEHEYARCGAWAYIAALDVHTMKPAACSELSSTVPPIAGQLPPPPSKVLAPNDFSRLQALAERLLECQAPNGHAPRRPTAP